MRAPIVRTVLPILARALRRSLWTTSQVWDAVPLPFTAMQKPVPWQETSTVGTTPGKTLTGLDQRPFRQLSAMPISPIAVQVCDVPQETEGMTVASSPGTDVGVDHLRPPKVEKVPGPTTMQNEVEGHETEVARASPRTAVSDQRAPLKLRSLPSRFTATQKSWVAHETSMRRSACTVEPDRT